MNGNGRYEIRLDDEDGAMFEGEVPTSRAADDQVTVTRMKSAVTKRKGRGFSSVNDAAGALPQIAHFDSLAEEYSGRALKCSNIVIG